MAKIVLGLGASHAAVTFEPAAKWPIFAEFDKHRRTFDYDDTLKRVRPGMDQEITPERMEERYLAGQQALATLNERVAEAAPDIVVIMGDDQHEHFLDDYMPMFCIYRGASMATGTGRQDRERTGRAADSEAPSPPEPRQYRGAPELAEHLIRDLASADFDVAHCNRLKPEIGLGHAFTHVCQTVPNLAALALLPVMVNTYFPPNQPTSWRCYALGNAIREAIEAWDSDARVALMASGGLSHQLLEEEFDRSVLQAMQEKDSRTLRTIPPDRLVGGTSEILNWVIAAGALEPLKMTTVDYVPAYRSPAGTGVGLGFAYWN
ncbi:MAG: protocatechuate 3,4-dioxygenase [Chloroflexi bacterium]|nr:protocatechuate 3,4-dioxygenase [Chloroflexota bacterium]